MVLAFEYGISHKMVNNQITKGTKLTVAFRMLLIEYLKEPRWKNKYASCWCRGNQSCDCTKIRG